MERVCLANDACVRPVEPRICIPYSYRGDLVRVACILTLFATKWQDLTAGNKVASVDHEDGYVVLWC